jgi:aryl-alcohol dehydrogenase-like predicted oxidoreductase
VEFTELGRTGLKVSVIGLGTWQWGSREWGWLRSYGKDDVAGALDEAERLGINLIDTAEIYGSGESERLIGELLKGRREKFFIASKFFPYHMTYDGIIKACYKSLERLRTSEIDLYQVHWPNPIVPMKTMMKAMEHLYSQGKIRAIGVSNFSQSQLASARTHLSKVDVASNQVKYNILERDPEGGLLSYLRREGMSLIAYSPLAQGLLTGKYSVTSRPSGGIRRTNILFSRRNLRSAEGLLETLKEIGARHDRTTSQVALNWLVTKPSVIAIPGAKGPRHVRENAGGAGWVLTEDELKEIERAYRAFLEGSERGYGRALLRMVHP